MDNQLHPVWQQVELLLNDGINLVPVRDKEEEYHGKVYAKKTPYSEWTKFQTERVGRQDLFHEMERRNTTAVAMVCGGISGNLEGIDIDEKYLPGISARFFTDLQAIYPDLFEKLRVHKTPSGGCHIPYRIELPEGQAMPRSQKLAQREAISEELQADIDRGIKKPSKTRCFIESRGEGGLMTCPPSMGYTVRKDAPIPLLTWIERCQLIEFCRAYNTYIKEDKPYKPNRAELNYYDENPFEHYNRTVSAVELLESLGWQLVSKRGTHLWFTRPGGRRGDVHASFHVEHRYFYVFTVSTELEPDRAYNLSTLLAHYSFGGDKQKTYQWLVEAGYGRIKPAVEQRIIRTKAMTGDPLPQNISTQGREMYQQTVEQLNTQHPHGIFWSPDDEGVMRISRLRFQQVAHDLGFRLYKKELVRIQGIYIHHCEDRQFYDAMSGYINEEDGDLYEEIFNAHHAFFQKNANFCITCLTTISQEKILGDSRQVCYKFFLNGFVEISASGWSFNSYELITDHLVWATKVQQRDFVEDQSGGLYVDFLNKSVELDKNTDHIMRCLGYLSHEWKDETTGYFIVLTERCPDPMQGGGSGKNLFCNLLKLTTTYMSIPGSQAQANEKFLQSWRGQKIFAISDLPKDFNFGFLKEMTTGEAILKKLFKNEEVLGLNDVPKFILQTNYAGDVQDGGIKGRMIQIEFTGFFNRKRGVDMHYGKHFANDWTPEDFHAYDTFIIKCIQTWMQFGLKLDDIELSATGWEKRFVVSYGQALFDFITENWENWKNRFISNEQFNRQLDEFIRENNINQKYRPTSFKINNALKEWCDKRGYIFNKADIQRVDAINTVRGRSFTEEKLPF
jgi:hypothetical protein